MLVPTRKQSLLCLIASTHTVAAFWRMACDNPLSFERLDPIVSPGGVASHVHNIAGGSAFGPSATYDSMQTSSCTSCPIEQDLSAYWTPELYYRYQNGSFISVPNGGTTVYYLQRTGTANEPVHAFPEDFRMISGNPYLRSYDATSRAQQAINFVCLNYASGSTFSSGLPTTDCPDGLRLQVVFPSCWDGVNVDSADHKSHVSFPTAISAGNCDDPKYPKRLITIFYEVFYDSTDFKDMWYGTGQPFVLANGDPTGYGFHGDFLNGWNITTLQTAVDTCTSDSGMIEDCPAFLIKKPSSSSARCHKSPSVNEVVVNAVLPTLPGCNPVTQGPANASPGTCTNLTTPEIWSNTTGYYGSIAPTGYHDLSGISVVQSHNDWHYIGCYADTSARVFPVRYTPTPVTVEACLDQCETKGYTFGGLEYGQECWCGKSLNAATQISLEQCDMTCSGNASEWCGGSLALTTYALSPRSSAVSSVLSRSSSISSAQTRTSSSTVSSAVKSSTKSSVIPTPSITIPKTVGLYSYLGCYLDSNTRVLTQRQSAGDGSPDSCAASCRQFGYSYMGLEYGGQCYCDNAVSSASLRADSDCNMVCSSNSAQYCGASWALQTYQTTAAAPVYNYTWSSAGCYTDSYTRTVRYVTTANATVDSCQAACQAKGYTVAGLENWTQCYCDDSIQSTGSLAPSTDCNYPCDKNHSQMCGGAWRLSIYTAVPYSLAGSSSTRLTSSASSSSTAGAYVTPLAAVARPAVSTTSSASKSTTTASPSTKAPNTASTLSISSTTSKATSSSSFISTTSKSSSSSPSLSRSSTTSSSSLTLTPSQSSTTSTSSSSSTTSKSLSSTSTLSQSSSTSKSSSSSSSSFKSSTSSKLSSTTPLTFAATTSSLSSARVRATASTLTQS